jgi:hypothetical protein
VLLFWKVNGDSRLLRELLWSPFVDFTDEAVSEYKDSSGGYLESVPQFDAETAEVWREPGLNVRKNYQPPSQIPNPGSNSIILTNIVSLMLLGACGSSGEARFKKSLGSSCNARWCLAGEVFKYVCHYRLSSYYYR